MSRSAGARDVNFSLENPARPQWDTDPACNLWVALGPGKGLLVDCALAERTLYNCEDDRDEGAEEHNYEQTTEGDLPARVTVEPTLLDWSV
ncbi:MAG: hypothetical protein WCC22_12275 [Terriglobales bacterium]